MSASTKLRWAILLPLGLLLLGLPVLAVSGPDSDLAQAAGKGKHRVFHISTPPVIKPETLPVNETPGGGAEFSVDNPANVKDYMQYEAYNTFPRDLDLWNLEGKRLIRSLPVISPDKTVFVYSEVMFISNNRQTYSRLYLVPVQPLPGPPQSHLPSEDALNPPPPPPDPALYAARFDPARTVKLRQSLVGVGMERVKSFDFKTLTVVDWSASGQRLLVKERSGMLHWGLRTTDILVYDQGKGTVTIYPEVQRIIRHYWGAHGNLPHLDELAWDIQPLGWETASDSTLLMKAWAYDQNEKKFLGLWRYDVDAERTELVQLEDIAMPVAANGWLATPVPIPPGKDGRGGWKDTLKHPFRHQKPVGAESSEANAPP